MKARIVLFAKVDCMTEHQGVRVNLPAFAFHSEREVHSPSFFFPFRERHSPSVQDGVTPASHASDLLRLMTASANL
jgi:hypothetical protein